MLPLSGMQRILRKPLAKGRAHYREDTQRLQTNHCNFSLDIKHTPTDTQMSKLMSVYELVFTPLGMSAEIRHETKPNPRLCQVLTEPPTTNRKHLFRLSCSV